MFQKFNFYFLLGILFLFVSQTACKKNDFSAPELTETNVIVRNFFSKTSGVSPQVKRVMDELQRQNNVASSNLVNSIVTDHGYARWDKSFVQINKSISVTSFSKTKGGGSDTIVIVPLIKDDNEMVNAYLEAHLTKDVKINLRTAGEYRKLLLKMGSEKINLAERFAVRFMSLTRDLYGINNFKITDKRLFSHFLNDKDSSQSITIKLKESLGLQRVTLCLDIWVTTLEGWKCRTPQFPGCNPKCDECGSQCTPIYSTSLRTECGTWFDENGGGGGNTGNGPVGDDGSTGGTTGGGTPPSNDDPCNNGGLIINGVLPPSDCDGNEGPGWEPEIPEFDPNSMYLELDQFVSDINLRNQFKTAYNLLEIKFQALPVDQYTFMEPDEFLQMLQNNPNLAASIGPVTILAKIGINAAADVLTQIFFLKLTDETVNTWGQAFDKIDWYQVVGTAINGLWPTNSTAAKFIVAAVNGATAVISDLSRNGFKSWDNSGIRFAEGFCAMLLGNYVGEVATKFGGINNFGKALVTKLDNYFPYKTVCKWLGGGVINVGESFVTSVGAINSVRKLVGWAPGKVCIIGRNMGARVKPVAQNLNAVYFDELNPIAKPYFTTAVRENWQNLINIYGNPLPYNIVKNQSLWYQANKNFIKDLQAQGYTFIDLGHGGYGLGTSAFYDMELNLIF